MHVIKNANKQEFSIMKSINFFLPIHNTSINHERLSNLVFTLCWFSEGNGMDSMIWKNLGAFYGGRNRRLNLVQLESCGSSSRHCEAKQRQIATFFFSRSKLLKLFEKTIHPKYICCLSLMLASRLSCF